jgi:drug/metabolite transporter (DMT)-like permease
MTAIVLALATSVSWGIGDFLGGLSSRRLPTLTVLAFSELAGLLALVLVVAVQAEAPPGGGEIAFAMAAGAAGMIGLGCLYRGMAVGAMGVVAPISSAAAVVPVAFGLVRGERPGSLQLVGVVVALAGVALASREPGARTGHVAAGVGLAVVAALGFGLYIVFIDEASGHSAWWAVLVSRAVATVLAVTLCLLLGSLRVAPARLPTLLAIGLFDAGANVLLALALREGLVSVVSVLASMYPLVTIALARALLDERVARAQQVGAAVAITGAAMIAAG